MQSTACALLVAADLRAEIVVVNDGSTDGTGRNYARARASGWWSTRPQPGLRRGAQSGIRAARGEIIVITDADGTYPLERIPELVAALERCDMAVGARTGETVRVPLIRRPVKWFITALAGYLAEQRIPDLNSGLRVFRRADALRLFGILPEGFSFTTTITLAMMSSGLRVEFIPINYHRRTGTSKIRPMRDTWNFLVLIVHYRAVQPLKVFLPTATVLGLGAGIASTT